jgi:hypothetical protein
MRDIIFITDVEPLDGRRIRATFSDGAIKEIDLSEVFARGGVMTPIHESREVFQQVRVNPESGTVEWPGEIDLDPEVLYGLYEPGSGVRIERKTIREPLPAAS